MCEKAWGTERRRKGKIERSRFRWCRKSARNKEQSKGRKVRFPLLVTQTFPAKALYPGGADDKRAQHHKKTIV